MRIAVTLLVILIAGCTQPAPHGVVVFPGQPNSDGGGAAGGMGM